MEIRLYLEILQRRKWVIVLTTLITILVAGLGSYLMTPIYSASTMVRIAQMQDNTTYHDLSYSTRLMNTYTRLLKSNPFLEEVIQRLGLNISPEVLAKRIKAEALGETELLKITAESPDPREAVEVANTLGALLIEQGQKVYSGEGKTLKEMLWEQLTTVEESLREDRALLQSLLDVDAGEETTATIQDLNTRIRSQEEIYATLLQEYNTAQVGEEIRANSISVVEPAIIPEAPSRPRMKLNIALGALVGLVGGVGLAFLLENLDLTLYSPDELETTAKGSVSGSISRTLKRTPQGTIILELNGPSSAGEAYSILRTSILSVASRIARKVLLITTVGPPRVKSRVLANLAAAMAQAGQKVVVVDADFREPCLHQLFDLSNELGVSNIIDNHSGVETALQETEIQGLRVLTSGPVPPNPARLLSSPKMQELVWELAIEADMVLLNTPPISHAADIAALAPIVDGVLLVADRDQAAGKPIQSALQEMDKVGAKVLGLLVDGTKAPDGVYYPRYRYLTSSPKSAPEFGLRQRLRSIIPEQIERATLHGEHDPSRSD